MKEANVLAWVKTGPGTPLPRLCELVVDAKGSFLVFQPKAGAPKHRQKIEHHLLRKVVPGQMEEVDYIYNPPLKLGVG